ncbi:MAG: redoxin domain-containing protein [Planctomycetota bacterium]
MTPYVSNQRREGTQMQKIGSVQMSLSSPAQVLLLGSLTFCLMAFDASQEISANDLKKEQESVSEESNAESDASEEVLAGHSFHGEAFNEGPRQKAYLMGGTGDVSFPVSTSDPMAQRFFDQGIGQLHGFWYFEAERSFRHVAMLDPQCAMAYWGMAMANVENDERATDFIKEGVERKQGANKREQLWIEGLADYLNSKKKNAKSAKQAYIRSLEDIIHEFPDDLEAKAFLAVRLWQFKKDLPIASHQAVDAILDQVFDVRPMHPAHHYRIHLWDREKPERALESAACGGQAGPSIAHLWHMPGHIYSRLERYADAVWQQEASSRADHAHMMRDRVLPDQIHNYAHNQEWMTRNLINIGRSRDALTIAKNLLEHPRHPKYNTAARRGRSAAFGRARLLQVLERFEMWDELIDLCESGYLEPTDLKIEQAKRIRALGVAYFEKNNSAELLAQLVDLQARLVRAQREQTEAIDKASKKATEGKKAAAEIEKAKTAAGKEFDPRIKLLKEAVAELTAYSAMLVGTTETSRTLLDQVRGIAKDRLARLHLLADEPREAERLAREAVESAENEVIPLANQVDVLFRIGKKKLAIKAFKKLREISSDIDDLTLAPFERISDVAAASGSPLDWRIEREPMDDVGQRPSLASIGPMRYAPSSAHEWSLPDGDGNRIALDQFEGQPVVIIFYLGLGCLHCAEQLTAFAPKTKDFADAGISLVAISTDNVEKLKSSLENFQVEGDFPFPLVSDAELQVFKAYRAFDDFEEQPLHGTFLVDGDGLVRWQDISYEPFDDADFLLKEAKRLLHLPSASTVPAANEPVPRKSSNKNEVAQSSP